MVQFTKIEKHPLENKYMLYAEMTRLFPFFGTFKQCQTMQSIWEKRLNEEFEKQPKDVQKNILSERKLIYKF